MAVHNWIHEESVDIAATPMEVYDTIRRLERMGEWSNENTGGEWVKGDGTTIGDEFAGTNRIGDHEWTANAFVTRAEPGVAFCFATLSMEDPMVDWGFHMTATEAGSRVTESWETHRLPGSYEGASDEKIAGRKEAVIASMRTTLGQLKASMEA